MDFKKTKKFMLLFFTFILLTAITTGCASKIPVSEYVIVDFTGLDGEGVATMYVDEESLVSDAFEADKRRQKGDWAEEVNNMLNSYEVEVSPSENLKNGDEVEVLVKIDEEISKRLSDKPKKLVVEGLSQGTPLTDEELENNTLLVFTGVSGRGRVEVDNNFMKEELKGLSFVGENDGNLKNGDDVVIQLENPDYLTSYEYKLVEEGSFRTKVKDLKEVAKNINDIANLEDVKRLLEEETESKYYSPYSSTEYEIVDTYYREFYSEGNEIIQERDYYDGNMDDSYGNGVMGYLLKITSQDSYSDSDSESYRLIAFPSVIIDEDNKVNIGSLNEPVEYSFKDSYSLETVEAKLQSEGFVKN